MVNAFEVTAHADGPGNRRTLNSQDGLHLIKKLDGVANFPVELIDEGENRGITQATYFQELDRSRFDALGAVDHHERRVHGSEGTVGIFGEVFVPGRIEQIHDGVPIRELHHRGGHGDPRSFSRAIQSEVAWRSDFLALTVPAKLIAPPSSKSFSVIVVLPASGWEMIAKVRRRATCRLLGHEKLPETRIGMGLGEAPCRRHCRRGAAAQKAQRFLTPILNTVRGPGGNHHRITGDHEETLFPQDHEPLPGENMVELLRFPVAMKGRNLPRCYPGLGQALRRRGARLGMSQLSNLRLV